jgi:hypothetical protein
MKARFNFIDPGVIMGGIVSLIVLAVGVFAFFTAQQQILNNAPVGTDTSYLASMNNRTRLAVGNSSVTGDNVFNILGVVLLIGAIMSIVGLVYNYVR